jgi:hypothetical protein
MYLERAIIVGYRLSVFEFSSVEATSAINRPLKWLN